MRNRCPLVSCLAALVIAAAAAPASAAPLAHMVYFKLKESTPAHREQLVEGCRRFLSEHEGVVYFAAGVLADELQRDVNDRDWDVSLVVVFRDKAAHDRYQEHPRHLKFIEEYSAIWDRVRVFDSYLTTPQQGQKQ